MNFKTFIFCCLFAGFIKLGYGQCLYNKDINTLKVYTVYKIDTLSVDSAFQLVLDHSISLLDSINLDKEKTWLYYAVNLSGRSLNDGLTIMISLQQGTDRDITAAEFAFSDHAILSGAFCYQGYTFFVLSNTTNQRFFNKYFTKLHPSDFFSLYGIGQLTKLGQEIDNQEMTKCVLMGYQNYNNELKFKYSVFLE